jgi:hypothetical protein
MSTTPASTGPTLHVHSSRLWAICKLRFTEFVFPAKLSADRLGITLIKVGSWLTPWTRQDEHLPMSHLAEVTHDRGLIWDTITIESSGGLNPLSVGGLPKSAARAFVAQVRSWMNG